MDLNLQETFTNRGKSGTNGKTQGCKTDSFPNA